MRLSLVSIPVELYSATKPGARVSFRQIHQPSGRRVRYQKVVEGIGPVDQDEILSGYEYSKDEYILIEPEEIDELKLETRKTFELVQFVRTGEISPLYFDKPYYLVPSDKLAEDAYRVVRDALRESNRVGLGQITMRGREYLAAATACGSGILVETLRYADEIRAADPIFTEIGDDTPDQELLDVATALIDRKTAPFKADAFKDNYENALRELIEAKQKSRKTPRISDEGRAAPSPDNVIDLMSALKASLEKSGGKSGPKSGPKSGGKSGPRSAAKSTRSRSKSGGSAQKSSAKEKSSGASKRKAG